MATKHFFSFVTRGLLALVFCFLISSCLESGDSGSGNTSTAGIDVVSSSNASDSSGTPSQPIFVTQSSPALTKDLVEALSARPTADVDYEKVDALLRKGLADAEVAIETAISKQEKIDYDRIRSLILQAVLDNLNPVETPRYQFICDVNDPRIYRCNLQTGEIECFSMSSNKLKLISSVR